MMRFVIYPIIIALLLCSFTADGYAKKGCKGLLKDIIGYHNDAWKAYNKKKEAEKNHDLEAYKKYDYEEIRARFNYDKTVKKYNDKGCPGKSWGEPPYLPPYQPTTEPDP